MNFSGFNIIFIITGIFVVAIFIFVFLMIFSPKLRGKFMSKQVKATKYMVDETKDDIEHVSTTMANATKGATKIKAKAIKEGFLGEDSNIDLDKLTKKSSTSSSEENGFYCKICGTKNARDAKFCKNCGRRLDN